MEKSGSDIIRKFLEAGIELSVENAGLMDEMIVFLQAYCQKVNLTAIRDREGIIEKHLIDSVLPLTFMDLPGDPLCLDIGTGAGFPAVPMMILRRDLEFTLLDAQRKRTDYLTQLVDRLGLKAEIIHGRAEELGRQPRYRHRYDMVTARAVADPVTLLGYAGPLLKKGGVFIAMRGSRDEMNDEVKRGVFKHGFKLLKEIRYNIPSGDGRRLIVFLKQ